MVWAVLDLELPAIELPATPLLAMLMLALLLSAAVALTEAWRLAYEGAAAGLGGGGSRQLG